MLAIISPAKKLDFESKAEIIDFTKPLFSEHRGELIELAKELSPNDLSKMMNISDKLADLNYDRYQKFQSDFTLDNSKQAIYAFKGDTYVGLDADSLSKEEVIYSQNHLRILSGLYGILRPLDLMQPYRLEMGVKFTSPRGNNLYNFWGNVLTNAINDDVALHGSKIVVNLASNEYIKAINTDKLNAEFITPSFKEIKNGVPKTIGIFAKKARGMMARYIIQNQIEKAEDLKSFDSAGYKYQPELSTDNNFIFTRKN